jgi:hypothetical protein
MTHESGEIAVMRGMRTLQVLPSAGSEWTLILVTHSSAGPPLAVVIDVAIVVAGSHSNDPPTRQWQPAHVFPPLCASGDSASSRPDAA